jgi:hypothetical protein
VVRHKGAGRATGIGLAPSSDAGDGTTRLRGDRSMPLMTVHQVWKHAATNEIWAVRLEHEMPTGVFGPIACTPSAEVLPELPYEEHSDDLEWVVRSAEDFRIID